MSLSLSFRVAAQMEFEEAAAWYEARHLGLGDEFIWEVQQIFAEIVNQPERYPIAHLDVREAVVRRFPYCVYYRVRTNRIVVIAVFDTSRDPTIWQSRA